MNPRITPGRLAVSLFLAVVGCFYAWAPATFRQPWLTTAPVGYYHELTEGFLGGHVHLPREPDPRLVALADPYDPVANAPFRLNDLSYFRGHYYLYHGAVPAVVLFAPVKLLTGRHLGEGAASLIFTAVGLAAAVVLLRQIRQNVFPRSSTLLAAACALALALAQGYQVVLRAGTVNQVPISSAYCFLMLGLLALWHARENSRSATRWLVLASLACGLAVASRPNYLFVLPVLLLPLALRWRAGELHPPHRLAPWLTAAIVPVALVLAAQLAYNHARFDSVLEFGTRYMLGDWDQRRLAPLGLGNLAVNAHHYLVSTASYQATFPFVTAPSWQAVGLIRHAPFLWLLLLLPLAWRASTGPTARMLLIAVAWVAGVNFLVLLLLPSGNPAAVLTSANARYLLDFQPTLVLLASFAALGAAEAWAGSPAPRRLLTGVVLALALVSAMVGLSLDFQRYPPEAYRPLTRLLNRPAWWWQGLQGRVYGPVHLKLELPANRFGAYEPLLATGSGEGGELLHIFYEAPGVIRLGLVDSLAVGPASGPIAVDYAQPHVFEIHLGSLYPPDIHPALDDLTDAQVATLRRRLIVRLDGRTVFEAPAYFRPNVSGRVLVGRTDFLMAYAQDKFTGRILSVTRAPLVPPAGLADQAPAYGALRLRLEFPTDRAGVTEPLVSTGIPQAGDLLHVTYRHDGAVRFGLDHWGKAGLTTEWIEPTASAHTLEFSSGALYPSERDTALAALSLDERRALKERVRLVFDGRVVLDAGLAAYDSSPYDVVPGCNPIGASSSVYRFTGRILESARQPFPSSAR